MDRHVTEVTEMSGRGTEVMGRVQRLWRYAEVYGGYGDMRGLRRLRWWCGNAE